MNNIFPNDSLIDRVEGSRCTSDYQCSNELTCKNRQCKDPCDYKECASNTDCMATNHRAVCSCKRGYSGHPLTECSRDESCVHNPDCASNRSCREGKCVDSCASECQNRSKCQVVSHIPVCDD